MSSILVISKLLPSEDTAVHGVYGRLDMFMSAISRLADEVRYLALLRGGTREHLEIAEERLRRRWSRSVRLQVVRIPKRPRAHAVWRELARGIFEVEHLKPAGALVSDEAAAAIAAALRLRPSLVFVHRLACLLAAAGPLRRQTGVPVACDLDDVEHVAYARRLMHSPRRRSERLWLAHWPNLVLRERLALKRATLSFVCSDTDAHYLRDRLRIPSVRVVSNSVTRFMPLAPADGPVALFIGAFEYRPNARAAEELIHEVWPFVRAQVPGARLVLVGRQPHLVRGFQDAASDIVFTGFVEDVCPVYRDARLVVCPIRVGSGTRVKIIEAAAFGRCVLTTSMGAEGLQFDRDSEIFIEDDRAHFASRCADLLRDPGTCHEVGRRALAKARRLYSREEIVADVVRMLAGAMAS